MENVGTNKSIKKRGIIDNIFKYFFLSVSVLCASIIIFIILFISIKGFNPFISDYEIGGNFYKVDIINFLFNNTWKISPNIYSIGFLVINTLYVLLLSLLIAIPTSIFTAIFVVRIVPKNLKMIFVFVIEILASIPSIIYGLFGRGVITLLVKNLGLAFGISTAGGLGVLSTTLVLAMMIMPTITLVSITAIKAVKKELIHASLALGASNTQTNFKVVLRCALPGIFSGIILGVGRALGEATAVTMVAGNVNSGPNFNLFGPTRTLTTTMLSGLKESTGLEYDIRFSVGIVLILVIIVSNVLLSIVRKKIGGVK